MSATYGHSTSEWESAREWIAERFRKVARSRGTETYGELAQEMKKAGFIAVPGPLRERRRNPIRRSKDFGIPYPPRIAAPSGWAGFVKDL